jgi:adenylosuccinate synthase
VGKVMGIFKAYCTRVGSGPFPTELFDATGERLRSIGREYGATTGRPRRCGWLDMVALKYAVMVNGVNELIMMKADVMNGFDTVRVATAYKIDGQVTQDFPFECPDDVEPVYTDFPGWKEDLTKVRRYEDFPETFKNYIAFIEKETGCPVKIISVGPDRSEIVIR